MALEDAESYISTSGLGPGGPVDPPNAPVQAGGTTPVNGGDPSLRDGSPARPLHNGPEPYEASTSSRRPSEGSSSQLERRDSSKRLPRCSVAHCRTPSLSLSLSTPAPILGRARQSHSRRKSQHPLAEDRIGVSTPRGFSPDASRQRAPTPPPGELEHWIFVGDLPRTVAERFIYDHLTTAGITVDDVFLSRSHNKPTRFAYVAVRSRADVQRACSILMRAAVAGHKLHAKPFVDNTTGSTAPLISNSDKRQYIGPERQAQRGPDDRRVGLFLMHSAPSAQPADVSEFLQRVLRADQIGPIEVRSVGMNTFAFIETQDEDACRKAIRELDGACFCGQGVRVAWPEHDRREGPRHARSAALPSREDARLATNYEPLATNRYAQLATAAPQARRDGSPGPSLPSATTAAAPAPVPPSSAYRDTSASSVPRNAPSSDLPLPPPAGLPPSSPIASLRGSNTTTESTYARDLERLHSIGLSQQMLESIEQMWRPISQALQNGTDDSAPFQRRIDVSVDFGFVPQHEARAALKQNELSPAYPEDPARQARYTAFLKAQAGESRDTYTVFFTQLAEFNASSRAFADKARGVADVLFMALDGPAVKREELA